MNQIDIEDPALRSQARVLMEKYDSDLYDIIKNYSSFRMLSKAKEDLMRLLKHHPNLDKHSYIQDYRKVKLFNLFRNQIRQLAVIEDITAPPQIQKHLLEAEKNFLLKMFLEDDLQVLGAFEAYLSNGDAQDMLNNLKIIVEKYGKYMDVKNKKSQIETL